MSIINYDLIPDKTYGLVVDVKGDVDLSAKKPTGIPVKFNTLDERFDCSSNQLTTLLGALAKY